MESSGVRKIYKKEEIINLIIMGVLSFFLLLRMILGPLTPVPIILMVLSLGRARGYIYLVGLAFVFLLFSIGYGAFGLILPVFFMLGLSACLAEAIFRNVKPKEVFLKGSGILLTVMLLSVGTLMVTVDKPIERLKEETKKELVKQAEVSKKVFGSSSEGNGVTKYLEELKNNSDEVTGEVIRQLPFIFTLLTVLFVWGNFLLVLALGRVGVLKKLNYPYTSEELLNFKVPEICIWPFILALLAYLFESHVGLIGVAVATNVLRILLIFYVLQGFGILVYLLNLTKIRGLFRILLFFIVFAQGPLILAALGVFDMWVNFRPFFKKRIEKYRGDNQR